MNKTTEEFFKKRANINDKYIASRYHENDRLKYDVEFIKKYVKSSSKVLDLGCGTGLIEDELYGFVASIIGVDKFADFIGKATQHNNVLYKQGDVDAYFDNQIYDIILLYGVSMYLNDTELNDTLENCDKMLAKDGVLIIKNQWGVDEDVIIDKYSEELNSQYYAIYRKASSFCRMMKSRGYFVEQIDIYPKNMNLWENTHEFAFVCKKHF